MSRKIKASELAEEIVDGRDIDTDYVHGLPKLEDVLLVEGPEGIERYYRVFDRDEFWGWGRIEDGKLILDA